MKRYGYLIDQIADYGNVWAAFERARKAKRYHNPAYVDHIRTNFDALAGPLIMSMTNGTYRTSQYTTFTLNERGKERLIYRLPFWPDRVAHHAIAQVLAPIWRSTLVTDTSASIPGRGIHFAAGRIRDWIRHDPEGTRYCLQMDVRKFYPSIPHDEMVATLARRIKDPAVMRLLAEIARSVDVSGPGVGLPIGNYLSQWFANLYLSDIDHRLDSDPRVAHHHRYCDDMVVFAADKGVLHDIRRRVQGWLAWKRLVLKGNWQVFPITHKRGLDLIGYQFFRDRTLLRKTTKKRMIRAVRCGGPQQRAAYNGWASFGSCRTLKAKFILGGCHAC